MSHAVYVHISHWCIDTIMLHVRDSDGCVGRLRPAWLDMRNIDAGECGGADCASVGCDADLGHEVKSEVSCPARRTLTSGTQAPGGSRAFDDGLCALVSDQQYSAVRSTGHP